MRLIRLDVEDFGCIRSANIEFGPGLNVLYGPNDLGKSNLAEAIRAVLLMQHTSSGHEPYVQWRTDKAPSVELVFQTEPQRIWRLRKTFGASSKGSSIFEFSKDGVSFTTEAKGRKVDAEVRKLLKWGIPEPGGRGGRRGIHESFLTTVLLAHQDDVTSVFRTDLSEDDDKSGRDRLTEALQAIAEDPLFTNVLNATQGKVDEAFTNTGRKKRGRASPFTEIADEVRKAAEAEATLEASLATSDTARERISELMDERLRQDARFTDTKTLLAKLKGAADKKTEAEGARRELERIEDLSRRVSETVKEEASIQKDLGDLDEERKEATAKVSAARSSYQKAQRALAEVKNASSEQKRKLDQAELEKTQLTLDRRKRELSDKETALAGIQDLVDAATDREQRLTLERQTLAGRGKELDASKKTAEEAASNLQLLNAIGDWLELKEVGTQLQQVVSSAERANVARQQVQEKREEADALTAIDAERQLPDDDTLSQLEELQDQLRTAEASFGVGLSLVVTPERSFEARLSRDGEAPQSVSFSQEKYFQAEREIRLEIPGLGSFAVTGGKADSRERFSALRQEWNARAKPVFAAAKAATLEELRQAVRQHHQRQLALQRLKQEIVALEAQVTAAGSAGDTKAQQLRTQHAALEEALAPFDRDVLEKQGTSIGSSSRVELRGLIDTTRGQMEEAKRAAAQLEVEIAREETQLQAQAKECDEASRRRDLALEQFGADWSNRLQKARADLSQISSDELAVREKIQALTEGQTGQLRDAEGRLEQAQRRQEQAEEKLVIVEQEIVELKTALGACQGRLQERRHAAEQEDERGARLSCARLEKELEALESDVRAMGHTGPIDVNACQVAEDQLRREQSELKQVESTLAKARGALSQTGGDVARERLEAARERHQRLRERESELDTEYGAWKLLLDTLHEAEQDQATHLGESIVAPITERFQELTGERYGQLELGPNMETAGIEAAGNQRPVDTLSVGTREQLATIFRLSLAEQLKSVLLLDDQLAQTDDVRMKWFRQKLQESSKKIQIVVFTCRPEDYLDENTKVGNESGPGQDQRARAVDLTKALERAG